MKKKLALIVAGLGVATLAQAQVSGIHASVGYGWSGAITDNSSNRRHLMGPELRVDFPLMHLPLVDVSLTGDVLLGGQLAHGGDLDGNVYRFLLSARASVPGSKIGVFGGIGWATAQARAHEFGAFNGEVMQLGVSFPLGMKTPVLQPSLEVAGTMASKSGLSGFSVSLGVRF